MKVFIVDDEYMMLKPLDQFFRSEGFVDTPKNRTINLINLLSKSLRKSSFCLQD